MPLSLFSNKRLPVRSRRTSRKCVSRLVVTSISRARPAVRAGEIIGKRIHGIVVIGVHKRKAHSTFGGDLFGPHQGMKVVRAGGFDRNVLHGFGDFQVAPATKIQPHGTHAGRRRRSVKIHRHADGRVPAPAQSTITEVVRKSAVPHQRMIQRFVVRQARGGECFDPHLFGVGGAVVQDQFVEKRKSARQSHDLARAK